MSHSDYSHGGSPLSWDIKKNQEKHVNICIFPNNHIKNKKKERRSQKAVVQRMPNQTKEQNRESLQAFIEAIKDVPIARRKELLTLVEEFRDKAKHQPKISLPTNNSEMKALGIELYPDFKKRTGQADGKECLKQNWRPWLKTFNPDLDRDYMSIADIRKLDPQLLGRLQRQYKTDKLHTFLPSLPLLNKQIAACMTSDERKEIYKKNTLLARSLDVA